MPEIICSRCGRVRRIQTASVRLLRRSPSRGLLCQSCASTIFNKRRHRAEGTEDAHDPDETEDERLEALNRDREA
jgi:uncharacterized protein YlaI